MGQSSPSAQGPEVLLEQFALPCAREERISLVKLLFATRQNLCTNSKGALSLHLHITEVRSEQQAGEGIHQCEIRSISDAKSDEFAQLPGIALREPVLQNRGIDNASYQTDSTTDTIDLLHACTDCSYSNRLPTSFRPTFSSPRTRKTFRRDRDDGQKSRFFTRCKAE